MQEINKKDFMKVLPYFEKSKIHIPMMRSVIEGNLKGRIFFNNIKKLETVAIITNFNWINVIGNQEAEDFKYEFENLLINEITSHQEYFAWANLNEYWQKRLQELFGNNVKSFPRVKYSFNKNKYRNIKCANVVPEGYELKIIDNSLIEEACEFLDGIKMFWGNGENFTKNGVGVCLLHENKIVSVCQSCTITDGKCEIDIFTDDNYRRRNLTLSTCSTFIDYCIKLGLEPYWECVRANIPSCKLAEKLGFEEVLEYPFYAWFKDI